ncbi:hypothetical protein [Pseudophaeobacter flagellatus]|uniref:hypothetical protein n=1 Tax=Pseudophaeobacter flagellatus TaxID=2899119 RepID=UPI001E5E6711|nr:hypothetical protein [Pseudophaeobacter flagellatus]MCD9147442.1 hypothetical protein [Pseudophaeobacter flagellatus]
MSYLKLICLGLAVTLFNGAATAQSMVDAKYGWSLIPLGTYLKLGGLPYSTKGAELIQLPGEIGVLQGQSGLTGPVTKNYFKRITLLEGVETNQGREFQIDRKILNKISGNGTANAKTIPALEGTPSAEVEANYDLTGTRFQKYTGLFLQVDNWLEVEKNLREMSPSAAQRFSDDNVRIVEAVLYATGFDAGSNVTVTAGAQGKLSELDKVSLTAAVDGAQTETLSLNLTGKSAIAYSYRMLCWNGKTFDKTTPDDIGSRRPSSCGKYK